MRESKVGEMEGLTSRVLVLECLLTTVLDTLVKRGRIAHSDLVLIIEDTEKQLGARATETNKAGRGFGSREGLAQLAFYKEALRLDR